MDIPGTITLCSYNIQYGVGKDGRVDLARIADEVGDSDIVCLQEVERFFGETDMADQPAEIASFFPRHHWVFGAGVDVDADVIENGVVCHRRRQFGNMVLSKTPILSSRSHLLPKLGLLGPMSLQRVAVEAVVEFAELPLRIYSVHLAHASARERQMQIDMLHRLVREMPSAGGVWSGENAPEHWAGESAPPPMPQNAILMGDFNLSPSEREYQLLVGDYDRAHGQLTTIDGLVDAWVAARHDAASGQSCLEVARGNRSERFVRLDYAFLTTDIAARIAAMRVDDRAVGSDHQPIFLTLDL